MPTHTRAFLEQRPETYLGGSPYLPSALKLINEFTVPFGARNPFVRPNLKSRSMTVGGVGNANYTERRRAGKPISTG
jgi:hypothetical protein